MVDSGEKFGKYTLVERLASGGMAEIFKARAAGVGGFEKTVAIKRLHRQYTRDSQFAEMLADEARLAVQLNHPNIGEVFDLGEIDGQYFIVMEYIDGLDLEQLAARTDISPQLAVHVAIRTADALHHAHTCDGPDGKPLNLVHRDVSPQNVMIGTDGAVKLVDFGVAKARMRVQETKAGVIKGKLSYMSPEQTRGAPLDGRADVYGLGMVMYEVLAGQHPFEGLAGEELYNRARTSDFAALGELCPDLPRGVLEVVGRALERDRSRRFEDARQMKRALQEVAASLPAFDRGELAEMVRSLSGPDSSAPGRRRADPASMTSEEYQPDPDSVIFEEGEGASGPGGAEREPTARLDKRVVTEVVRRLQSVVEHRPEVVIAVAAVVGLALGVVVWSAVLSPDEPETEQLPEAAVADGTTVTTVPPGAQLVVDGRDRGQAPVRLDDLEPGQSHSVEVTKEGYRTEYLELSGDPEVGSRVVRLEPKYGTVAIETEPEDLEVAIPGVDEGLAPVTWTGLDLDRDYRVEVRPPEGEMREREIDWEESEDGTLELTFEFEDLGEDEAEKAQPDRADTGADETRQATRQQPRRRAGSRTARDRGSSSEEQEEEGDTELDIWELGDDGAEGRLNVRTRADGGRIYVDGDMVKDGGDLVGHSLEAGRYEVEFHPPDGGDPKTRTVDIESGETSTVRFSR